MTHVNHSRAPPPSAFDWALASLHAHRLAAFAGCHRLALPPPSHPSLAPAPSSSASWLRCLPLKWGTRSPASTCPALPPYGVGCGSHPPTPLEKECARYTITARKPAHRAALLGGSWDPSQSRQGYVSVCTHLPAARAGRRDGHRRSRLWPFSGPATRHGRHTARPPQPHLRFAPPLHVHDRQLLGRVGVSRAAREAHWPEPDACAANRRPPPGVTRRMTQQPWAGGWGKVGSSL